MSGNLTWILALAAALMHAVRWVPGDATHRSVKFPAAFAALYVVYAGAQVVGGLGGLLAALAVVEGALQVVRRSRPASSGRSARDAPGPRRR